MWNLPSFSYFHVVKYDLWQLVCNNYWTMTPLSWKWNINHSSTSVKRGNGGAIFIMALQTFTLSYFMHILTWYPCQTLCLSETHHSLSVSCFLFQFGLQVLIVHTHSEWWSKPLKTGFLLYDVLEATVMST